MGRTWFVITVAFGVALAGCRACSDESGGGALQGEQSGPTMPTGMLVPASSGADADAGGGDSPFRVARHMKGGAWTELQIAEPGDRPSRMTFEHWRDDSRFVSLEAMKLLHEEFARALPGFDLFLPRLFAPDALAKLAAELSVFAKRSTGDIAVTARELATFATQLAMKSQSLWVLGP